MKPEMMTSELRQELGKARIVALGTSYAGFAALLVLMIELVRNVYLDDGIWNALSIGFLASLTLATAALSVRHVQILARIKTRRALLDVFGMFFLKFAFLFFKLSFLPFQVHIDRLSFQIPFPESRS